MLCLDMTIISPTTPKYQQQLLHVKLHRFMVHEAFSVSPDSAPQSFVEINPNSLESAIPLVSHSDLQNAMGPCRPSETPVYSEYEIQPFLDTEANPSPIASRQTGP